MIESLPANDNTRLPRHRVMTIAHGLSQPQINEMCIQQGAHHQGGAPIFAAPVSIGLISSIHHTWELDPDPGEKGRNMRAGGELLRLGE